MRLLLPICTCFFALLQCATTSIDKFVIDLHDKPNPAWDDLKKQLTVGQDSFGPAMGSTIHVIKSEVYSGPYANRDSTSDIAIHTLTNSQIMRSKFHSMSRWFQEDGNTQIFRMFPGEDNIRNSRSNAPRIEAYGLTSWQRGDGWHEWSGRYTFLEARSGVVLQIKHLSDDLWSMQLVLSEHNDGTINLSYQKLRDPDARVLLEKDVLMKSIDVWVLDDGTRHRVYVNGELRVQGEMAARGDEDQNQFRWGIYSPRSAMDRDILILVTGAFVGKATNVDFEDS